MHKKQQEAEQRGELRQQAKNEQMSWTAYIDCPIGNGAAQSKLTNELIQSTACLESSTGFSLLTLILKQRPSDSSYMSGKAFSN